MKIEVRWSGGNASRIKDYSAELVKSVPDIILANGSPVPASMKQATRSIPIVFVVVNDPVEQGFILSMAHPAATSPGSHSSIFRFSGGRFSCLSKWRPA